MSSVARVFIGFLVAGSMHSPVNVNVFLEGSYVPSDVLIQGIMLSNYAASYFFSSVLYPVTPKPLKPGPPGCIDSPVTCSISHRPSSAHSRLQVAVDSIGEVSGAIHILTLPSKFPT